jgi:hypothetical protein
LLENTTVPFAPRALWLEGTAVDSVNVLGYPYPPPGKGLDYTVEQERSFDSLANVLYENRDSSD